MKKTGAVFITLTIMVSLVSCSSEFNRGKSGTASNGVETGANYEMDKQDRKQLNDAFERGVSGKQISWKNANSGVFYTVTPQAADYHSSRPCRKANILAVLNGTPVPELITACRDSHGNWIVQ